MKILKLYIFNWKKNLALIIVTFSRQNSMYRFCTLENADDYDVVILI